MHHAIDFFQRVISEPGSVFNPSELVKSGGLYIVCLILFAEIAIFPCFFFPGDSLVFTAGVLCSTKELDHTWGTVVLCMSLSVILGNVVAYWFGKKTGTRIMKRKDSFFFRKKYVEMADEFYRKYEGSTMIIGNFLPVIRTFAPMIAGIINLSFGRFILFSSLGAILWIVPLVSVGYYLGTFEFVQDNLGYIVIAIAIGISLPVIFRVIKSNRNNKLKES